MEQSDQFRKGRFVFVCYREGEIAKMQTGFIVNFSIKDGRAYADIFVITDEKLQQGIDPNGSILLNVAHGETAGERNSMHRCFFTVDPDCDYPRL